jgi:hypothetical protein
MGGASATANRVRRNDELVDFKWGSGGDSATVQRRRIDLGAASSARFGAAWSPEGMGRRKQQRWERVGEEHVTVVFPKAPNMPCAMPLYPAC